MKKRNKLLAALLVMATAISLLSGCDRKIAEKRRCRNHHSVFMEHQPV